MRATQQTPLRHAAGNNSPVPSAPRPTPTPLPAAIVKDAPDWLVSYSRGDSCGARVTLSVLDGARRELRRALVLKCVQDFRQNAGVVTNGLPEFFYTGRTLGSGFYMSVFKFDGTAYREESCLAVGLRLETFASISCDGRGVVEAFDLK